MIAADFGGQLDERRMARANGAEDLGGLIPHEYIGSVDILISG